MTDKKYTKAPDFDEILAEELKNPKFKKAFDEYGRQLDISLRLVKLRKEKNITQAELARRTGIKQSNIARIESCNYNFTLSMLERITQALGVELKITF